MKYAIRTRTAGFVIAVALFWSGGAVTAADPPTCTPFTGTTFPVAGARLTYETGGRETVHHDFKGVMEGDKILVETSIPVVEGGSIVRYETYRQHIHQGSRQIVWTSQPVAGRSIPGVLPQSDYTDLWIPPSTAVGSRVNIQNESMLVGRANETTLFAGPNTKETALDSRAYDRTTGMFRGIESPTPSARLRAAEVCAAGEPEPPGPQPAGKFAISATGPDSGAAQREMAFTVSVQNNGGTRHGLIIDFEVYDASGRQVFQQFTDMGRDAIGEGATRDFVFRWTPGGDGTFTGKVGVFTSGWSQLLQWENELIPRIVVGETAGEGAVKLLRSYVTSTPYYLSQRAVLYSVFATENPPSRPVLLDLELYNAQNQKVAQAWFDNVTLSDANEIQKSLDVPRFLPGGVYWLKVGIFNPGWNGLIRWHDEALMIRLTDTGQWEDEIVVMAHAWANPAEIRRGQTSTLGASFMSPSTENHVYVDLALLDSANAKVAEAVHENVALPRSGTGNYDIIYTLQSPSTLAPGTYKLRVAIYTLGKERLIAWYDAAATLVVRE